MQKVGFYYFGVIAPSGPGSPQSRGFYTTQKDRPRSVGFLWTYEQPDAEKELPTYLTTYMTIHNTHHTQTSMPLVGFEPTIALGSAYGGDWTTIIDMAACLQGVYMNMFCA
jgi:hypothetical protein